MLDDRHPGDLRTLLEEYGTKALGSGGARGAQPGDSLLPARLPPHGASPTRRCWACSPSRDLRRLLRGQARTFGALASQPEALKDLVTDLDVVAGALASQDAALAASVPALRDTLRAGYPALADVDAALPDPSGVLPRGRCRACAPPPDARRGDPLDPRPVRSCSRPSCRGLAADLRQAVPGLVKLNDRLIPLLNRAARAVVVHEPACWSRSPSPRSRASSPATPGRRCAGRSPQLRGPGRGEPGTTTRTRRSSTSRASSRRTSRSGASSRPPRPTRTRRRSTGRTSPARRRSRRSWRRRAVRPPPTARWRP